jgi:hypothetical protein
VQTSGQAEQPPTPVLSRALARKAENAEINEGFRALGLPAGGTGLSASTRPATLRIQGLNPERRAIQRA